MNVTQEQLRQILDAQQGKVEVTIVSRTEPDMPKTDNPFYGNAWKVSQVKGVINWHYTDEVQGQRQAEGGLRIVDGKVEIGQVEQFKALPRKWGVRLPNSPFVSHKDQYYLELQVIESLGHEYRDNSGCLINPEKIKAFLRKSKPGRQGVKNEVILRDYRLDRIQAITLNKTGKTFLVVPDVAQSQAA